MEIAPGVHQLRMLGADAFLFTDDRLTLIDAGMAGSRFLVERYLGRIGRRLHELERVVCTHGHPDHIAGLHEIVRGRDDVAVLMHPADIAGLQASLRQALRADANAAVRRGRLLQYLTRAPAHLAPVEDGDIIPAGSGLRVVHTPGHTPGSICLYAEREGIVFTGDVLQVIRGRLTYASTFFSHDIGMARGSIERLAALDVATIAMSHYPPWRTEPQRALRQLAERATVEAR